MGVGTNSDLGEELAILALFSLPRGDNRQHVNSAVPEPPTEPAVETPPPLSIGRSLTADLPATFPGIAVALDYRRTTTTPGGMGAWRCMTDEEPPALHEQEETHGE